MIQLGSIANDEDERAGGRDGVLREGSKLGGGGAMEAAVLVRVVEKGGRERAGPGGRGRGGYGAGEGIGRRGPGSGR